MARFLEILEQNKMTLVVSLPKNSLEMAKVAVANGAQAIKMHLNVHHRASGNQFGSLTQELEVVKSIIESVNVPVGLVPGGAEAFINVEELEVMEKLGVDFFSVYSHHMPLFLSQSNKLTRMVAIDKPPCQLTLQGLGLAPFDVLEASIMPGDQYGTPLSFADIIAYAGLVQGVNKPVLIPTQKAIKPQEIAILSNIGVKAVMIGAVVTGQDLEGFGQVITDFAQAIAKL